jgi:hypothetical protein
MRIILKPAGLLIVGLAFLLLVSLVIYDRSLIARSYADSTNPIRLSPPGHARSVDRITERLQNPGFEGTYLPLARYQGPAHLRGVIAAPWRDDSSWATVSALYAEDTGHPHGGSACQRIEVQSARAGAVQLIQTLDLHVGRVYQASCWLRADRPTVVEVGVREQNQPFVYYGKTDQKIGTDWTQVNVTAQVQKAEPTLFVVRVMDPCSLLVDDASLTEVATDAPQGAAALETRPS